MVEQIDLGKIKEINTPISRAVVVLFPDQRTTGGSKPESPYIPTLYQDFRETTGRILTRYRNQGFKTMAVVYGDTQPDTFSYFYPQGQFQDIIRWETFHSWGKDWEQFYRRGLPKILEGLNLQNNAQVIVGGFHAKDCVAKFTGFLREKGFKASVDLRLTNELPFLLISHRLRSKLPVEMRSDHAKKDRLIWENMKATEEMII